MTGLFEHNQINHNRYKLSRDNAFGGKNGPETVTFLSPEINQHYTHLVAIDDFDWVNNGQDFFVSGSAIQVSQFH